MVDLTKYMKKEVTAAKASKILEFNAFASKIPDIVKFTVGEPDFDTPEHIKEAAIQSIKTTRSHYAPSNGSLELRTAASNFLATKYDQHYDPTNEVIITNGATEAIYSALTAILNPGDKVIIPTPIFPLYIADLTIAGASPIFINTAADGFKLTPAKLAAAIADNGSAVRAVVLNYPSNPTGVTYTQKELDALADVLRDKPIFALCDEIYSELCYETTHASLVHSLREQTILITGVSKSHAMTGWRIGIMCAPFAIANELAKVHQFATTTTSCVTQDAATEALANGQDDALPMRDEYKKRRDFLVSKLSELGFQCAPPAGAFYLFAKIPAQLNQNDEEFIYDLAKKARVAVINGSSFGPGGEGYIRLSYATSMAECEKGMARLKEYVESTSK